MFDIFYINPKQEDFTKLKERFPLAKRAESFDEARKKSMTNMLWIVWPDLELSPDFKFDFKVPKWDEKYVHMFRNGNHYDGVCLLHKNIEVNNKEITHRFFVNKKEVDIEASRPKIYDIFEIDSWDDYQSALTKASTDMFWMTSRNIRPAPDFKFDMYFSHHNIGDKELNHAFIHRVETEDSYNGIFLCSKKTQLTKREVEYRFPTQRREWDIVASVPVDYPKRNNVLETYQDYLDMLAKNDSTEMFWMIPRDVDVVPDFDFKVYFTHENEFDRKINHVFKNGEDFDGVMLLSRHSPIAEREFKHRFLVNKKEHDIQVSKPKPYDLFYIDSYEEYQNALLKSSTEMFWMSSRNLATAEDFKFDFYFTHHNALDRAQNHAFVHRVDGNDLYNGIFLCSKNKPLTEREISHRFPVERREWDIVASGPCTYDMFYIDTYEEYLEAIEKSKTEMFWMSSRNLSPVNDFKFDIYFTHDNTYDREQNHAFIHKVGDEEKYNGIFLLSKHTLLTKREIEYRNPVVRKEWDIVASGPVVYERYVFN
jgi:uncharacterized LabA/DUF88 family protein